MDSCQWSWSIIFSTNLSINKAEAHLAPLPVKCYLGLILAAFLFVGVGVKLIVKVLDVAGVYIVRIAL